MIPEQKTNEWRKAVKEFTCKTSEAVQMLKKQQVSMEKATRKIKDDLNILSELKHSIFEKYNTGPYPPVNFFYLEGTTKELSRYIWGVGQYIDGLEGLVSEEKRRQQP